MSALLHLMHLVSPALPVGAYAYSQGLEYAIDSGWLNNAEVIRVWLSGLLQHGLATTDLPVLIRCFYAWQSNAPSDIDYWNAYLLACRETYELQREDEHLGQALLRLLAALEVPAARDHSWHRPPSFACLFALAGHHWQVPLDQLVQGFAWSWLENQVAAATKLLPLGQTQAQQMLLALLPEITPACVVAASIQDADIGQGLPGLALASSLHETQYSRLFRS